MTETATTPWEADASTTPSTNGHAVVHFTIHLQDGRRISTYESGTPYHFSTGDRDIIPGLAEAVRTMQIGETRRVRLTPSQAFGRHDPKRVLLAKPDHVHSPSPLEAGQPVRLDRRRGDIEQAYVRGASDDGILFDLNHPLAGLDVILDVTLVDLT